MAVISPPRPKGPPLNALRAFEACARLGSFTKAADELCVTPGAVAQHIKTLEAWSDAPLFRRQAHGVKLTRLGKEIRPRFVQAFDFLGAAVQSLRTQAAPNQVRIAALPSVAQLWLSPRLPEIRKAFPDLKISVYAADIPPNLKREQFDFSIFFEELPGKESNIEICRDTLFPVCSPSLAARLKRPADLTKTSFLHDGLWSNDWATWMQAAAPDLSINIEGPVFSLYSIALEEAINSAGVLIAHEPLVRHHLERGTLVVPFATKVSSNSRLAIEHIAQDVNGPPIDHIVGLLTAS